MSNLFSRLSLRANIVTVAMACLLLVLVACGDGDSSLAPRDSDDSSSSICENSSSSRHCEDCKDEAISSSSSAPSYSSSSGTLATPCKTETEDNCEYGELLDTRDGQTYKTVKIGDQVWMAQNLRYAVAPGLTSHSHTRVRRKSSRSTGAFSVKFVVFC